MKEIYFLCLILAFSFKVESSPEFMGRSISGKIDVGNKPHPDMICYKNKCSPIIYIYGNGILIAEAVINGKVVIGWGEPCINNDCPNEFHQVADDLIMRAQPLFPGAKSAYR
jgi:hypothetical protein